MLLLFPSTNDHEVLPVRVPTGAFADSRFTINGWIHRQV
jgi:Rps23 Pro-64 3,4-dihydroxylase Tpa1-like proline 4-hydroxylase